MNPPSPSQEEVADSNAEIKAKQSAGPASSEAKHLSRLALSGAFWVTVTSAATVPLAYYRNWILGRIGAGSGVVGDYAAVQLCVQTIMAFVLFGGTSSVTNFLPKIKRAERKSAFLITYSSACLATAICISIAILIWPNLLLSVLEKNLGTFAIASLASLVPIVVAGQFAIMALAGLMDFRASSLLSQIQIVFVCLLGTAAYFTNHSRFEEHAFFLFVLTIAGANIIACIAGTRRAARTLVPLRIRFFLPTGFWWYTLTVHLNTLATFAYQSIDQLFVLAKAGTGELGIYFVLWQCAQLVTFVPQRIGQVMLAFFSSLIGSGSSRDIVRAYNSLLYYILVISTPIALSLILFSHPIAAIFGPAFADNHMYLVLLSAAVHAGCLGPVNAMLVLAKQHTGVYLVNSILLISAQAFVTFMLIEPLGIYGVVAGKASGVILGQMGLYAIVRYRLSLGRLRPPAGYWIALAHVFLAVILVLRFGDLAFGWAVIIFGLLVTSYLWLMKFSPRRILELTKGHL